MKLYPVKLRVSVKGVDRGADGLLLVKLPCPPSVGLNLADIYSQEALYIDQVLVSPQSHVFTVWCATIIVPDEPCESILERFVGEWEWEFGCIGEDNDEGDGGEGEPDEPFSPQSDCEAEQDNEYDKALKALLRGRQVNKEHN